MHFSFSVHDLNYLEDILVHGLELTSKIRLFLNVRRVGGFIGELLGGLNLCLKEWKMGL